MGEKERAEALLQAAGVRDVRVEPAAEQVTVSRSELEALRASAQGETPGQAYVRQQAEAQQAAAQPVGPPPPAGKAPLQNLDEFEALPLAERVARVDEADALLRAGAK